MLKDKLESKILEVAQSGSYINGPYVEEFEKKVAAYIGVKHAVGVASGTDALLLSLKAKGIGPGDEVITSPFTFFATSEIIVLTGAKPVFVDIEPDTMNIDPKEIEKKITDKTKAVIPVHIFGHAADMSRINTIAKKHDLLVFEDACQAIGSKFDNMMLGSIGDSGSFSFFPSKNLGAFGDAGLVTTNSDEIAEKVRVLRNHGSEIRYYNDYIGHNSRLDAMQAAILSIKLEHLDDFNKARRANAQYYRDYFADCDIITPQTEKDYAYHTYHQYTIKVGDGKRNKVKDALAAQKNGHAIYYPVPLHMMKAHADLHYKKGDLPITDAMCDAVISLPIFPELEEKERELVAKTVVNAVK